MRKFDIIDNDSIFDSEYFKNFSCQVNKLNIDQITKKSENTLVIITSNFNMENLKKIILEYTSRNIIIVFCTLSTFYVVYYPKSEKRPCLQCLLLRLHDNNPDHLLLQLEKNKILLDISNVEFPNELLEKIITIERIDNTTVEIYSNGCTKTILQSYHHKCSCSNSHFTLDENTSRIYYSSASKISKNIYRTKKLSELIDFDRFLDKNFGFFHHKYVEYASEYAPLSSVEINIDGHYESGWGRTFCVENSEKSAFLESIERYCNSTNRRYSKLIRGSYSELSRKYKVKHPSEFILTNKEYSNRNFKYRDFDCEKDYDWIFAQNLFSEELFLIPAQLVFYKDITSYEKEERFVFETSNGCALGNTMEEAIFYGILEILERDSFLLTWYLKEQVEEINWNTLPSYLKIINDRLKNENCEIKLFNITKESKIPAIWALYINHNKETIIKTFSAAGANINPISAIESAIFEVLTSVPTFERLIDKENKDKYIAKLQDDIDLIKDIDDHIFYHSATNYEEKMNFLLNNEVVDLEKIFVKNELLEKYNSDVMKDDLLKLIEVIRENYGDVYVVNITDKVTEELGLVCVKVLIPGLLNMSFGHANRRVNMSRILNYLREKGKDEVVNLDTINQIPHPFP